MDDGDNIGNDADAPRDFPSLRALIATRASRLPRRLGQVAEFALANPDDIAFGTAASVAQHDTASTSLCNASVTCVASPRRRSSGRV